MTVMLEGPARIVLDLYKSRDDTKRWGEESRHKKQNNALKHLQMAVGSVDEPEC